MLYENEGQPVFIDIRLPFFRHFRKELRETGFLNIVIIKNNAHDLGLLLRHRVPFFTVRFDTLIHNAQKLAKYKTRTVLVKDKL